MTATPWPQASTSAKERDPDEAGQRHKRAMRGQSDKKSQTTPHGSPTTMELQRSAQKTATDHPAPPQRIQEEQLQQTLTQHHVRAPTAVPTMQPLQEQVTEGQKSTKLEN